MIRRQCCFCLVVLFMCLACVMGLMSSRILQAQISGRSLEPDPIRSALSSKTLSTPRHLEAFTGKIASVRQKGKKLTMESMEGDATEIFSLRKGPSIRNVYGKRRKFQDLKPGMTLLVYYSSRRGRRTIKDVLILKGASARQKKASPES